MIYNFDFLVSRLPDIAQNFFCTPDGATDPPPFKWDMSQASSMFVAGDIIQKILGAFFLGHPVYFFFIILPLISFFYIKPYQHQASS